MKRASAAIVALALTAAVSGCNAQDEEDAEPGDGLSGYLVIYAAASLEPAFDQIEALFNEEHPNIDLEFMYDGSSVLATQIQGGAPADVFASADAPNMEHVTGDDLADGNPVAFATSELAIAVQPGNPFGIASLADLIESGPDGEPPVTVLCAPEVPCGNAANTLLERDGVELEPSSEEQNVTAVLTRVREGEADAGLVYLSDIMRAEGEVEGISIENAGDAAGDYLAVPLRASANSQAAWAFVDFLSTESAQTVFEELGFGPARD